MKKQNQGISLISLIITIIVIIILAAVVIFSGMGTPEKAQLSAIISDIDNVQTAVDQAYYGFYTEKSVAGEVWTKSQFYEAVATGETNRDNLTGTGIIPISDDSMVKMTLPKYEGRTWGVAVEDIDNHTQVGSVVLLPGYETDGKIYATLLDVQNDGRDAESMELVMQKVNEESGKKINSMEVSYNYGYVTVKVSDENLKKAAVNVLKQDLELIKDIGTFNTFEEFCDKIGENSEELIYDWKYASVESIEENMSNVDKTYYYISDNGLVVYGLPSGIGKVDIYNEITDENQSINIDKIDETKDIMKVSYQYGYVIVKIKDEDLKKAYLYDLENYASEIEEFGKFNTFEELCDRMGKNNPQEFLLELKNKIIENGITSNAYGKSYFLFNDEIVIY